MLVRFSTKESTSLRPGLKLDERVIDRIVDWISSKALDNSTPVGPGISSVTSVADLHKLRLTTEA